MLMSLRPAAAQIGAATDHEVNARYKIDGAYQVIVSGEGVVGEVLPAEAEPEPAADEEQGRRRRRRGRGRRDGSQVKLRFTVAADAMPGVRDFRMIVPQGASTIGQLVIARDPVISESDENDRIEGAQPVTLPATLCGAIERAEDVDFFRFSAAAGQTITFHVRGMRLEDRIHDLQTHIDPILTIRTIGGATLAAADNHFAADPLLTHTFEQAGDYLLEIRDLRYQGNNDWTYAIEASDRPFVTNGFPLAVAAGVESRVALVGRGLSADAAATLTVPVGSAGASRSQDGGGIRPIVFPLATGPSNDVAAFVAGVPIVAEPAEIAGTAVPTPVTVPVAINGRIESQGDIDTYAIDAKQGEQFTIEVIARRAQSRLDPILRVLNDQGSALIENDDWNSGRRETADPRIDAWTAPADGRYTIEVRDLHLRGGPDFIYVAQVAKSEPSFQLEIDSDKTLLFPGTGAAIFARAFRRNGFEGEIQLVVDGLPAGVTATCGRILSGGNDGCIILQAAADAPRGADNLAVLGTATHTAADGAARELSSVAQPLQEIYFPGGGRGHFPVELCTVSVGEPNDIRKVAVSPAKISLAPGGTQRIDVTIERSPEYKSNVTLDVIYRHLGAIFGDTLPSGVTLDEAASKTLLTGEETQGHLILKAADDAKPVENQQIAVMANVSVNFAIKMTYSSEPVFVTVAPAP